MDFVFLFDEDTVRRFWHKVIVTSKCWEWSGPLTDDGYGIFQAHSALGPMRRAHRVSCAMFNGYPPEGSFVLHSCDNPTCVRPEHLRYGTAKENAEDMVLRGRTRDQRGENHNMVKLDSDTVLKIRDALASSGKDGTAKSLSLKYGVSQSTISLIKKRKSWTHI